MSVDEKKEPSRENLDREIDDAVASESAGLDPASAAEIRERIRQRVRAEMEREIRIRTAAERRAEERKVREERRKEKHHEEGEMFVRFNRNFRFQHIVMFSSVILLIITGMPIKFPNFILSRFVVSMWGGINNSTIVHRIGAGMLIYFMLHHMLYCLLSREGRRDFVLLIPMPKDLRDAVQNVRYFLGKTNEKPKFGRFSYIEKFDYWAVYWGCVIMIGSGAFLWGESIALKYFPKFVLDIAHEMHSDEALLATLAIVIWHFYNVHFNPERFPGTLMWWHGRISEHEIKEEHPLEYDEIIAKRAKTAAEVNPQ
jgi:cytochrome b subunit of formate dehydrogenase